MIWHRGAQDSKVFCRCRQKPHLTRSYTILSATGERGRTLFTSGLTMARQARCVSISL